MSTHCPTLKPKLSLFMGAMFSLSPHASLAIRSAGSAKSSLLTKLGAIRSNISFPTFSSPTPSSTTAAGGLPNGNTEDPTIIGDTHAQSQSLSTPLCPGGPGSGACPGSDSEAAPSRTVSVTTSTKLRACDHWDSHSDQIQCPQAPSPPEAAAAQDRALSLSVLRTALDTAQAQIDELLPRLLLTAHTITQRQHELNLEVENFNDSNSDSKTLRLRVLTIVLDLAEMREKATEAALLVHQQHTRLGKSNLRHVIVVGQQDSHIRTIRDLETEYAKVYVRYSRSRRQTREWRRRLELDLEAEQERNEWESESELGVPSVAEELWGTYMCIRDMVLGLGSLRSSVFDVDRDRTSAQCRVLRQIRIVMGAKIRGNFHADESQVSEMETQRPHCDTDTEFNTDCHMPRAKVSLRRGLKLREEVREWARTVSWSDSESGSSSETGDDEMGIPGISFGGISSSKRESHSDRAQSSSQCESHCAAASSSSGGFSNWLSLRFTSFAAGLS